MWLKYLFDRSVSFVGLVLLSPVFLIVAVVIRVKMPGGPVLFKQKRVGRNGRLFTMVKFRSMTVSHSGSSVSIAGESRITPLGAKLRRYKLDELPELWNVLKGDMAIVGPRPLLVKYLPLYNEEQHHRHDVRPGLTGYAQAYGRNTLTWEERFRHDVHYVRNISFALDCKIIVHTVIIVLMRQGISSATSETMEEFKGNSVL